jgi:hypothetical protein
MSFSKDIAANTLANYLWWAIAPSGGIFTQWLVMKMGQPWYFAFGWVLFLWVGGVVVWREVRGRRLAIISAYYGHGAAKYLDVTDHVTALIRNNQINVIANNDTVGKGEDPYPRQPKTLVVLYAFNWEKRLLVRLKANG